MLEKAIKEIIKNELEKIAEKQETITYNEFLDIIDSDRKVLSTNSKRSSLFWDLLGKISEESYIENKILLSVIVISKKTNMPGNGFYNLVNEIDSKILSENSINDLQEQVFKFYENN